MTLLQRLAAYASDPDLCSHGDLVALCLDAIAELSAQAEEIARLQHDVKYTTADFTMVLDERDAKDAEIARLQEEVQDTAIAMDEALTRSEAEIARLTRERDDWRETTEHRAKMLDQIHDLEGRLQAVEAAREQERQEQEHKKDLGS